MKEYTGSIAYEVAKAKLAVPTRLVENTVTVDTTPTQIALNNPRRLTCIIVNHSADTIVVGFTPSMESTDGIILAPNGGTLTLTVEEDGEVTAYALYALGLNVGGDVYVAEVIGG